MIKGYLGKDEIDIIMDALIKAHGGKELVWIDMDGVVADWEPKAIIEANRLGVTIEEFKDKKMYRGIEGFYRNLPLIPGAKEAIIKLDESEKFIINFLSAPSWGNVSCFSDKRIWVEENFGKSFDKRMDLSFHKGHYLGNYLIDDRTKYGAAEFIGEHIQFGNAQYPNWDAVLNRLLS
ncbi:MAG: hypothetical protein AABY15_05520 [Nanoarchaeota archaeon]